MLCAWLIPTGLQANDVYVTPMGAPTNSGTMARPYDLATALSGKVSQPGDTFWLAGGNYTLGYFQTSIAGAPGLPLTFRPLPGEQVRVDGAINFHDSQGYVILRDFELYSSDTNRVSAQRDAGFSPTDIRILPGIASYVPNMSFINLVVHDQTRHGFYLSQMAANNLIYGCVVYNNGWASPDNAEGHGIYVQGSNGGREISENIVFNNSGAGLHIYENAPGLRLAGITLTGNVAFNAGAIQGTRAYRSWVLGVDAPALSADLMIFQDNLGFYPFATAGDDRAQIGRDGTNGSVAILNNYLPGGLLFNNWTIAAVSGNVFGAQANSYAVTANQQGPLAAGWNANTYWVPPDAAGFLANANAIDFSTWLTGTGFDSNSTYRPVNPNGTQVFLRPNWYEPGRANIIVYNWDGLIQVAVDVSSVLATGLAYDVRNAEDMPGPPVLSGVLSGGFLQLPLTGLTVAGPTAALRTASPTGPMFNVFVLIPRSVRVRASLVSGQAQISWPTNAGDWLLQSSAGLGSESAWADVASSPTVAGGNYVVQVRLSGDIAFYRLRVRSAGPAVSRSAAVRQTQRLMGTDPARRLSGGLGASIWPSVREASASTEQHR